MKRVSLYSPDWIISAWGREFLMILIMGSIQKTTNNFTKKNKDDFMIGVNRQITALFRHHG